MPSDLDSQLDIIIGEAFAKQLRAQRIPEGPLFVNRFLHGDPTEWAEQWEDVRDQASSLPAVEASIEKLYETLDDISGQGTPLPVIGAAEEAVTLNLTGLAVQLGRSVVEVVPGVRTHPAFQDEDFPGWSPDAPVDTAAYLIRAESNATDAALLTHGARFGTRPGDSARATVAVMRGHASRLAAMTPAALVSLAGPPSPADPMARNLGRMMESNKVIASLFG